jgi:hypothetical protein
VTDLYHIIDDKSEYGSFKKCNKDFIDFMK